MKMFILKSIVFILVLVSQTLYAAGSGSDSGSAPAASVPKVSQFAPLPAGIVALIKKKKQYRQAIVQLKTYIDKEPKNADAWNWLGYSYRKLAKTQDTKTKNKLFDQSLKAYKTALQLDPKHLGAHEYIGELYLQLRQPKKAKEHLALLKKYCKKKSFFGGKCEDEEYLDLKEDIEHYKP